MATQIGGIKVQVNSQNPTVRTINYGARTLKSATDLTLTGAQDGDVIVYKAATDTFAVQSASEAIPDIDAGFF